MSDKKLAIFPFCKEIAFLLRIENDIIKNYCKIDVYSEKSQGIIGRDINFTDAGSETGLLIKDIDDMEDYDDILIPKHPQVYDFRDKIFELIEKSLCSNKAVYDLSGLHNDGFSSMSRYFSVKKNCIQKQISLHKNQEKTRNVSVPVILICGLTDDINMLTLQLELRNELKKEGIKVSQVGSFDFCEFLGFHSFPKDFPSINTTYPQIIDCFRQYVYDIINTELPDIVVIGIPGGIMPYNKYINNDYGFWTHIVSSAVNVSYAFVCIPFMEKQFYSDEYFNLLDNLLYYKFAIRNKTYFVSNIAKHNNPSQKKKYYDVLIDKNTFWTCGDYRTCDFLSKHQIISYFDGLDRMISQIKNYI